MAMTRARITGTKKMRPDGRASGRRSTFTMALHAIGDHPDYVALSKTSRAFLWDFARQYNGYNNGNLSGAQGIMSKWGWEKKTALRCRKELEEKDWIRVTRYPRAKKQPVLYCLSWVEVDDWAGPPFLDEGVARRPRRGLR